MTGPNGVWECLAYIHPLWVHRRDHPVIVADTFIPSGPSNISGRPEECSGWPFPV